jgi:hypothetical protein
MLLMRRIFRTIAASMLTASASPVFAEPIPIVNIDQICRDNIKTDSISGSPQAQYETCFQSQQRSYDQVKIIWNTISEDQQNKCATKLSPQSRFIYSDLLVCAREMQTQRRLDEERSRKEQERLTIPRREFRY